MRYVVAPPDLEQLRQEADRGNRLSHIIWVSLHLPSDDRYLHWDKLRHLIPPEDLTHREWWLALRMMRGYQELPTFLSTEGVPFRFGRPDPIPQRLHEIDRSVVGHLPVDGLVGLDPPARERYVVRTLTEEAITSSQIEGAATTRIAAKKMLRSGRPPHDDSERMILNNYRAMQRIQELAEHELTKDVVLELHHLLTDGTGMEVADAAGRFRREGEQAHVSDNYGEVYHVAPPAEELDERFTRFCDFANDRTPGTFIHPVVRAIVLHFWLAYDHPFCDGNGRCARALFYWYLIRKKYWLFEFISISETIRKGYGRYRDAFLYTETDRNDLTYFILYHLDVIQQSIRLLHEHVRRTAAQARRVEQLVRAPGLLNHRQIALLTHSLRHPDQTYTVRSQQQSHNVVLQTARTDLDGLVEMGLLIKAKRGRAFHFRAAPDIESRLKELG